MMVRGVRELSRWGLRRTLVSVICSHRFGYRRRRVEAYSLHSQRYSEQLSRQRRGVRFSVCHRGGSHSLNAANV